MFSIRIATVTLVAFAGSMTPALATVSDGRIGTLPLGLYVCGTPGNAAGAAWIAEADGGFSVLNGSRYETAEGGGTYLLKGRDVTITSGPLKGARFSRDGASRLTTLDANGEKTRRSCMRRGSLPT